MRLLRRAGPTSTTRRRSGTATRGVAAPRRGPRERERRLDEAARGARRGAPSQGASRSSGDEVAAVERDRLRRSAPRPPAAAASSNASTSTQTSGRSVSCPALDVHPAAAEDLAEVVERAVEVVGAARRVLVGPERLDRRLARERPARRERDELQEIGRAAAAPGVRGDRGVLADHLEPAEQMDAERGCGRSPAGSPP